MPYFSFILYEKSIFADIEHLNSFNPNIKYFSKNTKIWKILQRLAKKKDFIKLEIQNRKYFIPQAKSILFCLPPSIGLGDSIEYALAIKSITIHIKNIKFGVAHVGIYKDVFEKIFNISNVYDFITEKRLNDYDTTFHFTLEIKGLKFQKYNRKNIETLITSFFKVPLYRKKIISYKEKKNTQTISIFPVSNSPIRSIPVYLLNEIIKALIDYYNIEIYLDSNSIISNYIYEKIIFFKKIKFKDPENLNQLINDIKEIEFGIFCDSGPLHLAKYFNLPGILLISSVKKNILLNDFSSIKAIKSNYSSRFCSGPCGLVNAFEIENKSGCYDQLQIEKKVVINMKNLKSLQRGDLKKNYLNLYINSVNCYKKFNIKKIIMLIQKTIKKN